MSTELTTMGPLTQFDTVEELLAALPHKPWSEERLYDWVAFTPSKELHDSGYNQFILIGGYCGDTKSPEILSTSADHLWFDSINHQYSLMAKISMDCLGVWVRVFNNAYQIKAGMDVSSYSLEWVMRSTPKE